MPPQRNGSLRRDIEVLENPHRCDGDRSGVHQCPVPNPPLSSVAYAAPHLSPQMPHLLYKVPHLGSELPHFRTEMPQLTYLDPAGNGAM